ncbi:hypothetical protein [Aquimarina sp. RZ0]|nr:hypothetical protein [Aquimarina sp. RZ0]
MWSDIRLYVLLSYGTGETSFVVFKGERYNSEGQAKEEGYTKGVAD